MRPEREGLAIMSGVRSSRSRLSSGRSGPHPVAVFVVKTVHTAVFLAMLSSICWLVVTGLAKRRDRSVAVAAGLIAVEAAVFVANDGVCPLTPLTERLGATRGSVSDIFLPTAVARTIPIWSSALVAIGVLLHVRAALAHSPVEDVDRLSAREGKETPR
jgi:hypothetical protein